MKAPQLPREFFYEHAGYSWNELKGETQAEGHQRCAEALAAAELRAKAHDCTFEWSIDDHQGSREWTDDKPSWATWRCYMRDEGGIVISSLSGIDFGRDGEPWGSPYMRVVEAELALEFFGS